MTGPYVDLLNFDRWALFALGVVVLLQCVALSVMAAKGHRLMLPASWARIVATVCFDVYVVGHTLGRLGQPGEWLLPVGNASLIFGCYGIARQLGRLRDPDWPEMAQVPLMVQNVQDRQRRTPEMAPRRVRTGMAALALAFVALALALVATVVAQGKLSKTAVAHENADFCAVFNTLIYQFQPYAHNPGAQALLQDFKLIARDLRCKPSTKLPRPAPTP